MKTKEIPIGDQHYPIRTCGYKNRRKYQKMIVKALAQGVYGQFTGVNFIKPLDIKEFQE
jgi:hypothetical protein